MKTKIEKVDCFRIEEQPGDGTRYTHFVIKIDDERYLVQRDIDRGGASFQESRIIYKSQAIKISGLDVEKAIPVAKDLYFFGNENPYTFCSACRSVFMILKREAK